MGGGFLFARLTVPQTTEGWTNKGALKAGPSCTICKIVRIFAETNLTPHIMARYINPFTDWGFKHIFGQEITKDYPLAELI